MSLRKQLCIGVGIVAVSVGIAVLAVFSTSDRQYQKTTVRLGDGVFTALIAQSNAQQAKGLGGITRLSDTDAMLFVYEAPRQNKIWMKNMNIPIDVIWLDREKRVVHIERSLQPSSYPKTYGPTTQTQYVLEVAAGTVDTKQIGVGTQAGFTLHNQGGK